MVSTRTVSAARVPNDLGFLNPIVVDDLIRLGNKADGGYVLPKSVPETADALISFGIGNDWMFEKDMFKISDRILIHAYDHTVGQRRYLRQIAGAVARLLLGKPSLADVRAKINVCIDYRKFFHGRHVHYQERVFNRSDNQNDATIDKVFSRLGDQPRIILKMDIEGCEYRVITDILTYEARIPLMIIEFHDTEPIRDIFIRKVQDICKYYDIVHVHGNNYAGVSADGLPEVLEITFLHKSLVRGTKRRDRLPLSGIDFPNDPTRADLCLVFSGDES
jgi:hypothetical protein